MTDGHPDEQHTVGGQWENTVSPDEVGLVNKSRHAQIAAYQNTRIGVCIYLTIPDLRELGVNLSQLESDVVEYTIDDETSRLTIRPLNR